MSLEKNIKSFLGWSVSITKKIWIVYSMDDNWCGYPVRYLLSCFVLPRFLLPIKVVLLFGSDSVPNYFPELLQRAGRNDLLIWLSVGSVMFYLCHLQILKIITTLTLGRSCKDNCSFQ